MKTETYLQIPKPCHEDWDKMTENQQGRYCQSCCKTVVDFEMLTDQQILNFLNKSTGQTCGRFTDDQLNRALEETKFSKKKGWKWAIASITSLFFFVNKSNSQNVKGKIAHRTNIKQENTIIDSKSSRIVGDTIIATKANDLIIGNVLDEKGNPVAYAMLKLKFGGHTIQETADSTGRFSLHNLMKHTNDIAIVEASSLGYDTKIQAISLKESKENITINLKQKLTELKEVVVVGSNISMGLAGRVGGYTVVRCKRINKYDTAKSFIRKVLKTETFKIFPNPASKGKPVNIIINEVGEFSIQLLDNNSRLLYAENTSVANKQTVKLFTIPATVQSGIYYIRLINEKNKKQYVDKLIIQ